jgi:branched-chain amino acid transport system substrate-binding protein
MMVVSLLLAACGTRLDHDAIVAATSGGGPGSGAGFGQSGGVPAADGLPAGDGGPADAAGSAAGDRAALGGRGGDGGRGAGPGESARGGDDAGPGSGGGKPIVIGNVGTYSGPIGVAAAPTPKALQAWAAAVNAKGGIDGRKVQVIVKDDGGNGAKSRSLVQELVEEHKVVALVGVIGDLTISSWRKYVEDKRVPVIGGSCSVQDFNRSPMLFSQCSAVETQAFSVVKAAAQHVPGKKFGALTCKEAPACSYFGKLWFEGGYAKKAGVDPVYRAEISLAQPDYTSECIGARNAGATSLTVLGDANTLKRVAAACRRQNYHPTFVEPSATVSKDSPSVPGLGNVVAPMPTLPFTGLSTPAAREFEATLARYGGGEPQPGSSVGWAAAKVFEKAARLAGRDISREGLLKALPKIRNDRMGGVTVPITYGAGGPTPDFKCWFVMKAANGKWIVPEGGRPSCR